MGRAAQDKGLLIVNNFVMLRSDNVAITADPLIVCWHSVDRAETRGERYYDFTRALQKINERINDYAILSLSSDVPLLKKFKFKFNFFFLPLKLLYLLKLFSFISHKDKCFNFRI